MKEILNAELHKILKIYLNEFSRFMEGERIEYLSNEKNVSNIIKFSDDGFGAWCSRLNIMFGSNTGKLIESLIKRNANYATNPNAQLVTKEEFINNDKDYLDYLMYFTLKGCDELDYYLDMLPHEAAHLIGIGGGVIPEGVAELRARETCLKYGIRTAPILHSKEVKLVSLLEQLVGVDIINRTGFNKSRNKYIELQRMLDKQSGVGTFRKVFDGTEPQYSRIYLYGEYSNPIEKFLAYRNLLDFSDAYDLLNKKIKEKNQIDI